MNHRASFIICPVLLGANEPLCSKKVSLAFIEENDLHLEFVAVLKLIFRKFEYDYMENVFEVS